MQDTGTVILLRLIKYSISISSEKAQYFKNVSMEKIKKLSVFKVENWRVMRRLRQRKCVGHQAVEMSAQCTLHNY